MPWGRHYSVPYGLCVAGPTSRRRTPSVLSHLTPLGDTNPLTSNRNSRRRAHRGSSLVMAVVALASVIIFVGLEMDMGRMSITRHKDQVIADACALAGAQELPYQS